MQELDDRKHEGRLQRQRVRMKAGKTVSNIDPRFRQQMWKLMKKRPKKAPAAAKPRTSDLPMPCGEPAPVTSPTLPVSSFDEKAIFVE